MGEVQRQGLGEDKEYVAHKIASIGTDPSTYIAKYSEECYAPCPPSSYEGGGGGAIAPLALPIPTPIILVN